MWCIIVLGVIGLIIGIVLDIMEGTHNNAIPVAAIGAIAGLIIAIIISLGVWAFVPNDGCVLTNTATHMLSTAENGELHYFKISHHQNPAYLYYLDNNNEMQRLSLSNTEVHFVGNNEDARVEQYEWYVESNILRAITFKPLTRMGTITHIYISETDWLQQTDNGATNTTTSISEGT